MVGIVVTISPNFNLYRIVVLPAASRPTIKIRISFLPKRPANILETFKPIVLWEWEGKTGRQRRGNKQK
jgi:hypothetical protein